MGPIFCVVETQSSPAAVKPLSRVPEDLRSEREKGPDKSPNSEHSS